MRIKSAPLLCLLSIAMLSGCSDDSTLSPTCDNDLKTSPDCTCNHGEWSCPDVQAQCPPECPNDCDEDGTCPHECPEECPNSCDENGTCPHECPEECPNSCDENGTCPRECPEECPNSCDENGTCPHDTPADCPEECPEDCDLNGNCPSPECPETCPDNCTDGECNPPLANPCPEACPDSCDPDGNCKVTCPEECKDSCDDDGKCPPKCPAECPDNCVNETTCPVVCPDACPDKCSSDGKCPCPSSCTTSCNDDGVCQCPSECATTCNSNGECPVMCGSETVESMYFLFPENDLLVPGYKARQAVTIPIYIKTNKKTYKNTEAPCEIVLKSGNEKIMKVAMKDGVPTFSPVAAGRTTGTATIKGQKMSATVKINVLDPDNFKDNVAKKDASGKLVHVYKGPFKLNRSGRVCQAFDFNTYAAPTDSDYVYFTQLSEDPISVAGKPYRTRIVVFPDRLSDLQGAQKAMSLFHFGHQGIAVERTDGKDYIWLGSYGTLKPSSATMPINHGCDISADAIDTGFGSMQTITRVPFEANKSYYPKDFEHYYLPPAEKGTYFHKLEPALDIKNNRFLLRAKNSKDDKTTYIKVYDYKKVLNLPLSSNNVTLANNICTLDDTGKVVKQTISTKVKDLSTLTPIHEFAVTGFPGQSVTINNGIIYAVTNQSKELSSGYSTGPGNYTHNFRIIVKLYSQGGIELASYNLQNSKANDGYLINKEMDPIVNENDENGKLKYWNVGYFEPEGIQVREGKVYISISAKRDYYDDNGKVTRTGAQYIWVYDLAK